MRKRYRLLVRMTSTTRSRASGSNQRAQEVPTTVNSAVATKMPVVETPLVASDPAPNDPNKIPVKTHVFSSAMTEPRGSDGARHWMSEWRGTKINALASPRMPMRASVHPKPGATSPSVERMMVTPIAPSGIKPYSTRPWERCPANRAPAPMPIDNIMSGSPDCQSDTPKTALAQTRLFCAKRQAIVQKKTAPQIANRSRRSEASAVQAPCHVLNSPPSVRAGGTGGIVQAAANPTSERRANGRGANQVESPVTDNRMPGVAVPV